MTRAFAQGYMDKMAELRKLAADGDKNVRKIEFTDAVPGSGGTRAKITTLDDGTTTTNSTAGNGSVSYVPGRVYDKKTDTYRDEPIDPTAYLRQQASLSRDTLFDVGPLVIDPNAVKQFVSHHRLTPAGTNLVNQAYSGWQRGPFPTDPAAYQETPLTAPFETDVIARQVNAEDPRSWLTRMLGPTYSGWAERILDYGNAADLLNRAGYPHYDWWETTLHNQTRQPTD